MVRLHRQKQHLSGCCFCFTAYHSDQPLVTITTVKRCRNVNLKEKVMSVTVILMEMESLKKLRKEIAKLKKRKVKDITNKHKNQ